MKNRKARKEKSPPTFRQKRNVVGGLKKNAHLTSSNVSESQPLQSNRKQEARPRVEQVLPNQNHIFYFSWLQLFPANHEAPVN